MGGMTNDGSDRPAPRPRSAAAREATAEGLAHLDQTDQDYQRDTAPVMDRIRAWGDAGQDRYEQEQRDKAAFWEETFAAQDARDAEIAAMLRGDIPAE